ncbi:putative tail tape measure domain protein [Edwardsiella phage vB_EtaM_ET-ABTNL-9]|nr:putative tail tape measure domain protein [Edwardsiella phage vB_EtaM_ET-ABTNL-9]
MDEEVYEGVTDPNNGADVEVTNTGTVGSGNSDLVEASEAVPIPAPPISSSTTNNGKVQFGRLINVEILDFKSGNKTTVGNVFEIEFSFFKTLDHVKEDDMGQVKIYGLTKERIKSFQSSGGEIRVYAGYIYNEIVPVFVGRIARLYGVIENGVPVLNIECSSNMMNHYISGSTSSQGEQLTSVGRYVDNIARLTGYPKAIFDASDVPQKDVAMVKEFLYSYPAINSFVGDVFTLAQKISAMYGFEIMSSEVDGVKVYRVRVGDKALKVIRELTAKGYPKGAFNKTSVEEAIEFTQTTPEDSNNAVVLNHTTGLISSSIEYKITKAFADQELGDNEEETLKSQGDRAAKLEAFNKSEEERKKKAEAKGKQFVPKDPPKSLASKYVNRKYNKVRALFNPNVRPQGLVVVYDSFEDDYAIYRVRSMNITCNNKKGDWVMELNCEDSKNLALTAEQLKQIENMEQQEMVTTAPDQPVANLSGSNSSRRDIVMRFFMSKGWTKNQAAGITANLQIESYNVKTRTMFDNTVYGDGGKAYGLAQWHSDRQRDFANAYGRSIQGSSLQQQLEFVHFEMTQGKEQGAGRRLKASTSAYQAGAIVSEFYERPQATEKEKRVRGNLAETIAKLY